MQRRDQLVAEFNLLSDLCLTSNRLQCLRRELADMGSQQLVSFAFIQPAEFRGLGCHRVKQLANRARDDLIVQSLV